MIIEPLTHSNPDGQVYERLPHVIKHIEVALTMNQSSLLQTIRVQDYHDPAFLSEECLVYLIRHYHKSQQREFVNAISEALIKRCNKRINEHLQSLGSVVDLAFQDVIGDLFEPILDLSSDRGDFLQVRFWVVLNRLTITTFKKYVQRAKQALLEVSLSSTDTEIDDDDGATESIDIPASSLTLEEKAIINMAVNSIQEPYRTVYILCIYYKWQVESTDPTIMTVSRYYQKTPRTIRNWLKQAEEALAQWRDETI